MRPARKYTTALYDLIYSLCFTALGSDAVVGTIQATTDCEATWQLVRTWLQTCEESHPTYAKRHIESILPTRLISVGTTNSELKIVPSQLLSSDIQYLTLSHCWGNKIFTTLRMENYSDFLTNIPEAGLSKTFRDAIYTTRELGFKYLWIDSLCIIQGDDTDWQTESALMGHVYSNSSLNLAAADAPDGDTSLFFDRDDTQSLAWRVSVPIVSGSHETRVWDCELASLAEDTISHCVLGTRAWTFQERFLSSRSLYFGRAQT
ncbi:HET-domain-containing protein [Mollisia scopiformis]|uniref:HET-domain-containing protein n=1 Tax=Mollisia scopiformis TaxID=149040 RepID=A0A194WZV7_MOLSC|nr:HET-domain-containing protein [Mollisia scopiformis]KUJ13239.1 HET-domain-containing protein [Mollisia scopiformis]